MACSYVLLPRAQMDFENIVRYLSVELASPSAAARFVDEFEVPSRFLRTFRRPHGPALRCGYSSSSVTFR